MASWDAREMDWDYLWSMDEDEEQEVSLNEMPGASRKSQKNFSQQAGTAKVIVQEEKSTQVNHCSARKEAPTSIRKEPVFPKSNPAKGQVILLIRFNVETLLRLKNACTKSKRIVEDCHGTYLGFSDNIILLEGSRYRRGPKFGVLMVQFRSMDDADRWIHSDPIFRQNDWPSASDSFEAFAVPMHYLPPGDLKAFQLTEMYGIPDSQVFEKHYVSDVCKLLDARQIYHGVLATHEFCPLRNCMVRPNTFLLLNAAESIEKLCNFYDSKEYKDFREERLTKLVCENDSMVFTIQPMRS